MRRLTSEEQQAASGGNPLAVLAAVVLVYEAANIAYEFGQGFAEGYRENDDI